MARAKRDAALENRTNRLKLKLRKEPYWSALAPGQHLGYYRPTSGAAGSWVAKWRDPDTGARRKTTLGPADDFQDAGGAGGFLTWGAAQEKAREWFDGCRHQALEVEAGEAVPTGPYTVADAIQDYMRDAERRGMKSLGRTRSIINAHILPVLGELPVTKLTRGRIEKWHSDLANSARRLRTKLGASEPALASLPKSDDEKRARKDTANRVLSVLKAALNLALDRRKVRDGEAWKAVKPFTGVTTSRVRFLTQSEQVRLVNACPDDFRELVIGALHTGARYGELVNLKVQDFSPQSGTVFIAQSKNGRSRHVVLTEEGQAFFEQMTAGRKAGEIVFLRSSNPSRARSDEKVWREWRRAEQSRSMIDACAKAEIEPQVSFHELRHTYASGLLNRGVPLAYVAAQLGHTDTRMVERHYGHIAKSDLAEAIRKLAPRLGLERKAKVANLDLTRPN